MSTSKYTFADQVAKQKSKDMADRKKAIREYWQKWEDRYNDSIMAGIDPDDIDCF